MIERTQERFGIWPERLVADAADGSASNLAWRLEHKSIAPHIPVCDKSACNDGSFERANFSYDHEDDRYIGPSGDSLRRSNRNRSTPRGGIDEDRSIRCSTVQWRRPDTRPTISIRVVIRALV